ncbi:acyl--CoA ligase [Amycolatopsis acidicola]|uniref:Acyl--CoA ligase n=1 Tax=Amycolatopsis acidicola TaxID=2596893 RepID=A0A5N0VBR5_9PSEU|nr:class I adenylate-forming enzyme family protein [Amycolatopsis acidicola]KAA9162560.1 acyl--CoA ligase [Amycolatopsis acidicola]
MATLAELVGYWARWQPGATAWMRNGERVSWAQAERNTGRVAAALHEAGVLPGDRIGILGANSLAWCEIALATLRAGCAVVPLNVRATPSELAYMIDTVGCRAIAVDGKHSARLDAVTADRPGILRIGLDADASASTTLDALRAREPSAVRPAASVGPDTPAVIAFTSGTTGHPKGATLTHANIAATVDTYTRWENWGTHTKSLLFAPLAFTGGVVNALLGLYGVGGTLILEDFHPARALEQIVAAPVTAMTGVPITYESIVALPEFAEADLSALTTAITGGSVVTEKLLKAYADKGVQLREAYGLTEACGGSTLVPREHFRTKSGTAGIPGVHCRLRIVDGEGATLPTGSVGEIAVQGPQVMSGYWGDPVATAGAIRDGWLHTGDLGRLDDDGFLSIVDRKKDMIISGGINVYPAEIERVVASFPGVEETVAVGVAHERWGETVAVVVGGEVDLDELYAYAREHLADYKLPRYLHRATEPLPRSMSGKLLRRVVRAGFDVDEAVRTPSA